MTDRCIHLQREERRKPEVEVVIGHMLMSADSKQGKEKTDLELCVQKG